MKAYFLILYTIVLFFTNTLQANPESDATEKKMPKVLVLIIASDSNQAYMELQKIWRTYMNSDPEHFEVYFIRGNPDLTAPYEIKGNDLYVKTEEGYTPGIVNKTVLSLEVFKDKLKDYDYVLRTNLSSFYVFPRLLDFLATLPKTNCYCGVQMYIPPQNTIFGLINFVSGAGIIMSSDLATKMVEGKEEIFKINKELPDDVLIGLFFQRKSIFSVPGGRVDFQTKEAWEAGKNSISDKSFHFRAKNNYNFRSAEESFADELYIDKELIKMFYPNLAKDA